MGEHSHDIHYMLIVLILAFFVITLSLNKLGPDMLTGQVIGGDSGSEGFVVKFLRSTARSSNIRAVNAEGIIDTIKFNVVEMPWGEILNTGLPKNNIGGEAVSIGVAAESKASSCDWINVDNKDFRRLKSLSGYSACRAYGYGSCITTNIEKTKTYYNSSDGSCSTVLYRDESNDFRNCYSRIQTSNTPCFKEPTDVTESSYTTVLCCK